MALKQNFETQSGAIASYWRITSITLTPENTQVTLDGYIDEDTRRALKAPLASLRFEAEKSLSMSFEDAYLLTKRADINGMKMFTKATDV